jgi:hypothetical protein
MNPIPPEGEGDFSDHLQRFSEIPSRPHVPRNLPRILLGSHCSVRTGETSKYGTPPRSRIPPSFLELSTQHPAAQRLPPDPRPPNQPSALPVLRSYHGFAPASNVHVDLALWRHHPLDSRFGDVDLDHAILLAAGHSGQPFVHRKPITGSRTNQPLPTDFSPPAEGLPSPAPTQIPEHNQRPPWTPRTPT